jgi:hypothetical protein
MIMPNVSFTMTDFTFPANLKDAFATFRIQLALRYTDKDGKFVDVKEILPGAGENDFWECEKGNKGKKNFVRQKDAPKIDISKIPESGAEALFAGLAFKSLNRVMVTIFDIEKDGKLDKFWRGAVKIAFGAALDLLPAGTAITVGNVLKALKKKPDDRSDIEKQFDDLIDKSKKAGKTRLLWEHSTNISTVVNGGHFAVTGDSPLGIFTVQFATEIS